MEKLILKKIRKNDHINVYGFDVIEILTFNYDGIGTALALADGDLISLSSGDIDVVLFGAEEFSIPIYELDRRKEKIKMILEELEKEEKNQ